MLFYAVSLYLKGRKLCQQQVTATYNGFYALKNQDYKTTVICISG